MIEELMPGTKTKLKILKAIYENPGINITNLIKKVKASPNLVLSYVNLLSTNEIINEERVEGKKKIHVRSLRANFNLELGKTLFALIEKEKKSLFFKKYKNLKPIFEQLEDLWSKKVKFVLVYGSYARLAATEESDLDLLIIGMLDEKQKRRIKETFVSFEGELSLKIEKEKEFLRNINKPLYKNILKEHMIVFGEERFMEFLGKIPLS